MNEEHKPEPKINGIEGFLMIGLAAVFDCVDLIAFFLNGFFGVGIIISIFNNVIASVMLSLWAMMKGVGPERTIAAALIEFIPIINALPVRTILMIVTVWLDWHPKQAAIAAKAIPNLKNPKRTAGKKARATEPSENNFAV